ncbi:MAG: RNA polymerase sigma factor [Phycisphaeraceae bacterium]|nr:RNA polymerase sigma factor [Phycisphaeraceae bacterium]
MNQQSAGNDGARVVAKLFETHGDRLHALARRLCGHRADAEDMVQEVFMKALRKWHTFKGTASPGTWLFAIAARSCKARTRRKGGVDRRVPAFSQLLPWHERCVMEIAAEPTGIESGAERKEAVERVQAAIVQLPEHLRLPVIFKDVLELGLNETAQALNLHAGTVKTRLHRARLALRKAMRARSSQIPAPVPIYGKQVCLDLLRAKLDAMDRGDDPLRVPVPKAELCARCGAVFRELDLVQEACAELSEGRMPPALRARIRGLIEHQERTRRAISSEPRRGRRPLTAAGASKVKAKG